MASYSDLVDQAAIAAGAGVTVEAVRRWRARHDDFPAPVLRLAVGPIWSWPQVKRWLVATGRLEEVSSLRCRCCGRLFQAGGRLNICGLCSDANCLVPAGCSRPIDDEEVS